MSFLFGKKKTSPPEDMRMRFCAPSFSFIRGEVLEAWNLEEIKKVCSDHRDSIALVYPGLNMLLRPREWAKELSRLSFIILCGNGEEKEIVELKKALENEIYSPMRRPLQGVVIASTLVEAEAILNSLTLEKKSTITVNSTEGELS